MLVNLPALCWGTNTVGWRQLVDNIFLFKLFPETTLITYITWALVYEMWFYLFFSVVFILPSRWNFSRSLAFFWAVSLALTLNVLFSRRFDALCDPRFLNFMVGIPHAQSESCSSVSVSLGVASVTPEHDQPVQELIAQAEAQLELAKQNGGDQVAC